MTKTRSTKSALISSVLALVLCFTMLLGTTFAWFTDSVTSANNIIQSGTLNVEMYYADGSKAVPADDSSDWKDANGVAIYTADQLWEPGYTDAKHIKISNEGSLALKYQLAIIPTGEVSILADVIDVYLYQTEGVLENATQITDRTAIDEAMKVGTLADVISKGIVQGSLEADTDYTTTIVLKMQESAGNDYQNKSIGDDFTIKLLATQYTSESDSFDDQYDADAWMEGMQVYSAEDLQAAINNGETNIVLMDDIVLDGPIVIPAPVAATMSLRSSAVASAINLNGKSITAGSDGYAISNTKGGTLVIEDTVGGSVTGIVDTNKSTTIINGGTFNATEGAQFILLNCSGNMTINNATINACGTYSIYSYEADHKLVINDATVNATFGCINTYGDNGVVEINGGTFNMTGLSGTTSHIAYFSSNTEVTINGGGFNKIGDLNMSGTGGGGICIANNASVTINGGSFAGDYADVYNWGNADAVLSIKGGTFKNSPSAILADGFKVVEYNGMYVVVGESAITTTEELVAAINNGATEIELAPGSYTWPTSYNGSGVNTLQGKTLTVKGTRNSVIEMSHVDEKDQYVTGATLAFEGITLNFSTNAYYMGFANTASLTYKDCAINGWQFSGTNVVFEDCDLNSNGAEHCVWTWGAQNLTFTRCDFTYTDRAVNCYGVLDITTNATFTDCTFNKVEGAETTGAIETNSSTIAALNLSINNCTVNEGDLWFIAGWDNKSGANTTATVDGVAEKGVVLVQSGVLPYLAINSNSTYELVGDFGGINVSLVMAKGVENVIFDGSKATNINELIITQNGQLIDNATTAIGDRSGNVTVQKFNVLSQINVFACNTEAVVQNNTAEALMVYAGNCDIKVLNNIIDANFESHPTYKNATETWNTNKYGITLNIFNYNLWLDGNTVTDATGHAIGINGWEGTFDTNDYENKIESFKGNNITVNSTTNTKRAAFKVWDDETYASNDDDTNVVNATTQAFINAVLADGSNTFNILEGYEHTIFSIYNVNTNN